MLRQRRHLVWSVLAVLMLANTSTGQACDCLWPWNWCRRPTAAYAPATYAAPAAAPACGPCVPATTYMPVTAYRTVYQPTAVTAYQPVRSGCGLFNCFGLFDCCGRGSAATTYRPVTSVVYRPALMPYTTYRPVTAYSASSCVPSCDPCSTTTYSLGTSYSSTLSTAAPASGCASGDCGAGVIRSYPAASESPATTVAPNQPAQTFKSDPQQPSGGSNSLELKPQTDSSSDFRFQQPELIRPNVSPTSHTQARQATFYRPVAAPAVASAPKTKLDTSGWHSAGH